MTLQLTGERTLPGIAHENYWFRRHEAAYAWLEPFCTGGVVVDAGCGEGYGAALLRRSAYRVIALDYLPDVAGHVAARYPHLDTVRGDLQRMPLRNGGTEVVACLQTIEHLHDQPGFVAECARVLRPAGTLLMTTPNRLTFSPGRDTPVNPFHTREVAPDELRELLAPQFEVSRLVGLNHGRRLRRWERRHGPITDAVLAGAPEEWPAHVARIVRAVRATDFTITGDVDTSLDLLAVAVRRQ